MPNLSDLTELEYIYYSVGFLYCKEEKMNQISDIANSLIKEFQSWIEFISAEIADIKLLTYDVSSCVRGIGGVKQSFNINNLASVKLSKEHKTLLIEPKKEETEEERLQRHREFFQSLRDSYKK